MKITRPLLLIALVGAFPIANATHVPNCEPSSAPPGSYWEIPVGDRLIYQEERGNPVAPLGVMTAPGLSYLFGPDRDGDGVGEPLEGEGSWTYQENNVYAGLQRGGDEGGSLGGLFPPGCDANPNWHLSDKTVPCLIVEFDPIEDETCHQGADYLMLGLQMGPGI